MSNVFVDIARSQQLIETRTALRFHFMFENGKGSVELATEQGQLEFAGEWRKKVCRGSFEE
jgi:hypothetical protein